MALPDPQTRLLNWRHGIDLSQRAAAIRIGMSQQMLAYIETRKRWPSKRMQKRIARSTRIPAAAWVAARKEIA